jgi:hypothetical protein
VRLTQADRLLRTIIKSDAAAPQWPTRLRQGLTYGTGTRKSMRPRSLHIMGTGRYTGPMRRGEVWNGPAKG